MHFFSLGIQRTQLQPSHTIANSSIISGSGDISTSGRASTPPKRRTPCLQFFEPRQGQPTKMKSQKAHHTNEKVYTYIHLYVYIYICIHIYTPSSKSWLTFSSRKLFLGEVPFLTLRTNLAIEIHLTMKSGQIVNFLLPCQPMKQCTLERQNMGYSQNDALDRVTQNGYPRQTWKKYVTAQTSLTSGTWWNKLCRFSNKTMVSYVKPKYVPKLSIPNWIVGGTNK